METEYINWLLRTNEDDMLTYYTMSVFAPLVICCNECWGIPRATDDLSVDNFIRHMLTADKLFESHSLKL